MRTLFILLTAMAIGSAANATTWNVYRTNNQGAHKLLKNSFYGAYQDFISGLAEDPLNPVLQLNLGLAFEINEEYDKAEQAYQAAGDLAPGDKSFQYVTKFNIGEVRGKKKNIEGALAAYQQALDLNPNSLETKTNIELLVSGGGDSGESGDKGDGGGKDKKPQGGDDQKDQQKKDQQGKGDPEQQPKQQPKPFSSKELTPADVKKILDEIKNQEQAIRAQDYKKGPKESARGGKDW